MIGVEKNSNYPSRLMRYEKVFAILIKYGFEDVLSHPPLSRIVPQNSFVVPSRKGKKVSQFTRHERIRMVCEELGTTFIKLAQIASNRPDLLPEELISELTKLQDNAPVVPIELIKEVLEKELPRPLDELLDFFDEQPLASASMAQVHRARLKGGKEVVLKIQRPNIRQLIADDIAIMKNIVSVIETYMPQYQAYHPRELVKMFENSIREELSFTREANNLKHFSKMFLNNTDVYIPNFYKELSTDRIICMEYIDGYKITDLKALKRFDITGEQLATKGISLYFEQVFEHSFFHADPHPGNIFVLENGKIAFIDYGMMGTVIESDKILFTKVLLAMYERDARGLKKAILKFSTGLSKEKERELEYDIIYFLRNYTNLGIEDIDANEVMLGLNSLLFDYKIKIPSNLLLLIKALGIIEGVGLKLDPRYDIIDNIGPYAKRLLERKYNPQKIRKEMLHTLEEGTLLLKELPGDLKEIANKIKEGKLHIEFEHKGLAPLFHSMDTTVNRISFTLIIVALIIASAIIIFADIPPHFNGISIVGLGGFALSALAAFRLLYSIVKHGNF